MKTLDTKQNILDDAGFAYSIDRMAYFNRKTKKIFSVEYKRTTMRTISNGRFARIPAVRNGSFTSTPSRLNRSNARSRLRLAEAERTIEDRLREEYFALLPEISRVAERLEAEIRYLMLPISGGLRRHERLAVKCRVKSCESALDKPQAPGDKGFRHKPVRDLYAYKLERPCRRSRSRGSRGA